jgi:Domain of unknown function (DUF4145)
MFIVDCPYCKAKVGAKETGRVEESRMHDGKPVRKFTQVVVVGNCIRCGKILVGQYDQCFDYSGVFFQTSVVRVFPKPPRTFASKNIPPVAAHSLEEADCCLQAGANLAACVMFGRALEAVCAHKLLTKEERAAGKHKTLATGIKELHTKDIIDARLLDWSEHLRAFRNIAAHASDQQISRQDAEDLQAFVYAIIEYIYDLTERYEEFKLRMTKADEIPF